MTLFQTDPYAAAVNEQNRCFDERMIDYYVIVVYFVDRLYANHSDCAAAGETCHSDAHCVDDGGTLSCVCADGFTGDGVNGCTGKY